MRWIKQGLVFAPVGQGGWMNSHAQMPTVLPRGDILRVYFSTRPAPGVSLPGCIDVRADDPSRVIEVYERPLMQLGPPGSFDEHGVMPAMVLARGEDILLYYTGWSRLAGKAPYNNSSGLAVSHDGGLTFERLFPGPVLTRTPREPLSATLSWITIDAAGLWHMWYSSGIDWVQGDDHDHRLEPVYVICHAWSHDGIDWTRDGHPVVMPTSPLEAQSRPTILRHGGAWHMWFCHRGSTQFREGAAAYRMGYAHSTDLRTWQRDDDAAGIDVAQTGWDATMVAYPCVVETAGNVLMFYNGNGFGASGIGWAKLAT
jgi:predicted GH43/DUF377 family glycosyl hydrolase